MGAAREAAEPLLCTPRRLLLEPDNNTPRALPARSVAAAGSSTRAGLARGGGLGGPGEERRRARARWLRPWLGHLAPHPTPHTPHPTPVLLTKLALSVARRRAARLAFLRAHTPHTPHAPPQTHAAAPAARGHAEQGPRSSAPSWRLRRGAPSCRSWSGRAYGRGAVYAVRPEWARGQGVRGGDGGAGEATGRSRGSGRAKP